jgi:hypothetical protein
MEVASSSESSSTQRRALERPATLPPGWKGWHGGKGGQHARSGGRANKDGVELRGSGDEQGAGECGPGGEHKERGRGGAAKEMKG